MLPWKAVRLLCLDERREPIPGAYASGFICVHQDGHYLYTAWHVVAGFGSPRRVELPPPGKRSQRRTFVRVQMQNSIDTSDAQGKGEVIGGLREVDLPLYDELDRPLWLQEPEERVHDLNRVGLRVSKNVDPVRLRLPDRTPVPSTTELADNFSSQGALPADRIHIVGYPYGYSVGGDEEPFAVVVTRQVAGMELSNPHYLLLDGPGTPGMSGGPVFLMDEFGHPRLLGIYSGIVRPDAGKVPLQELVVALGECSRLWHVCGENGPGLCQRGFP